MGTLIFALRPPDRGRPTSSRRGAARHAEARVDGREHDRATAVARALADAVPALVLARPAGCAPPRPTRWPARPPRTSRSSAPDSPGCGPRSSPRSATRTATWSCWRRVTAGWAATGRNGGFCCGQPHPRPGQRHRALPRRDRRRWRSSASATSTRSRRPIARYGIDCDFERTGELSVATADVAARRAARRVRRRPAVRRRRATARPRRGAGRGRVADVPRRPLGPGRLRDARPGPAGLGAAGGVPAPGRTDLRGHRRSSRSAGGGRRCACARRTARSTAAHGRAGHRRVPGAAAAAARLSSCRSTTTC